MEELDKNWKNLIKSLNKNFGEELNLKGILYLIGVQELNLGITSFPREEKLNVIHVAVCKILSPYGYYTFDKIDEDGWPHYIQIKPFKSLSEGDQEKLMRRGIINYFNES